MEIRTVALAWMLTIAVSYFSLAIFAPTIGGDTPLIGTILYALLGLGFLIATILPYTPYKTVGRILQFVLGVILALGAVLSWTGVGLWNVPFPSIEIFQVSMAILNILTAVFAFSLALDTP